MKLSEFLSTQGIKQTDFARRIGCSDATVSRLISGKQRPDFATMAAIERATNGEVRFADFAESVGHEA